MYKILLLLFISLFFVSCGLKNNAFRYFEKDEIENLKLLAWKNYLNAHKGTGLVFHENNLSKTQLDGIFFFIKKNSSLKIKYKLDKFVSG